MRFRISLLMSLVFIVSPASYAAEFTLKWGVNVEPVIYYKQAAAQFKANVEKRSNGRIEVLIYENAIPEEGHQHLPDVQSGLYHMGQATTFQLEKHVPEMALWNLPYLFKNDQHVTRFIYSDVAQAMLKKLESENVVPLGFTYSGGFLQFYGNKISSLSEVQGKTIALEESGDIYQSEITAHLKAKISPEGVNHDQFLKPEAPITVSEIITSTVREIFHLAQKRQIHLNMTDHRVISRVLYISKPYLESLPADLREIVLDEGKKAARFERELSIQDQRQALAELRKQKIPVNQWSSAQKKAEKKKFEHLYQSFIKKHDKDLIRTIESM